MASHIVISGTGRAGTTFLVELLTHLGFDTGFSIDSIEQNQSPISFGGLEHDIRSEGCPYIVKAPGICDYIEEICTSPNIIVEHLFVPIRNLRDAANSRRASSNKGEPNGGLWDIETPAEDLQEQVLSAKLYQLLYYSSIKHFPITLLQFPELATNPEYLYGKLMPLIDTEKTSLGKFSGVFYEVAKPERIHSYT